MGATYNFHPRFAKGSGSKAETPDQLLNRQPRQKIWTGMSLVSLSLGFSVFGILIILNRHRADLNGLSGDSFAAQALAASVLACAAMGAKAMGSGVSRQAAE